MREEQGGPWPIAYLVSKEFILVFVKAQFKEFLLLKSLLLILRWGWSVVGQVQAIVQEQTDQVAWLIL